MVILTIIHSMLQVNICNVYGVPCYNYNIMRPMGEKQITEIISLNQNIIFEVVEC